MERHYTHSPINHLTWVDSERPEETDDSIAEDSSREGRKNGSRSANFRVVE